MAHNSILNFNGVSIFSDNSAGNGGGILAFYGILNFPGNVTFNNNSAKIGGGIHAYNSILNFAGGILSETTWLNIKVEKSLQCTVL